MCGICGVLCLDGQNTVSEAMLRRMVAAQKHRGPDDEGYFQAPGVGFGGCRLAIIDLTPAGHQPMANEDKTVWLVFNGEIYNFQELVPLLERRGHLFRSRTDSEVILHAYEQWGPDCLHYFNGMFAFAIWDSRRRQVFLARDRLGVKPLYYWSDGSVFAFSSELKSLLVLPWVSRQLNLHALYSYLLYEYVPAPECIFSGMQKLPAGHSLTIRLDGSTLGYQTHDWSPHQYWNLQFQTAEMNGRSLDDYVQELRALLKAAVQRRLVSDVPLGVFLSGGMDSSTLVAIMAEISSEPIKTFSIGFTEHTFSELHYAQLVANHFETEHHVEILQPDSQDLVQTVADFLDEPFADASALPTYLVSRMARQHVTVALSGDGGDEFFAGYDWYRAQKLASMTIDRLPQSWRRRLQAVAPYIPPTPRKKGLRNTTRRFLEGVGLPPSLQQIRWQTFWQEGELAQLLTLPSEYLAIENDQELLRLFAASGSSSPLDQQQYVDIKRYLSDDNLFKMDRMSMAVSLEAREPLLDYTLAEFVARLPASLRMHGLSGKYLLRRAMRDVLPPEILNRPKLGFNMPYKNWLRHELRGLLLDALSPTHLRKQGLFDSRFVSMLLREHLEGVRDHAHKLWQLLMFQLWEERYRRGGVDSLPPAEYSAYSSSC